MRTYTEQEVARIVKLRQLRHELLRDEKVTNPKKLKTVSGELWQLTQNPAYR